MKLSPAVPPILRIVRMHIVFGGVLAFTLGALLALVTGGVLDPLRVALFYGIVLFGDLSTHYGNDYFDAESDRYIERKKFFSGKNILSIIQALENTPRTSLSCFLYCRMSWRF